MADAHYPFNDQQRPGRQLRSALIKLEEGYVELEQQANTMIQMLDGDGSDPSHYGTHVTQYEFASTAEAKAAHAEIQSAKAALDGISATLAQLFARLR